MRNNLMILYKNYNLLVNNILTNLNKKYNKLINLTKTIYMQS